MGGSLWGSDFDIFNSQERVRKVLEKLKDPKELKTSKKGGALMKGLTPQEKIQVISSQVEELLGHLKKNILIIRDRQTLHEYVTKAISNGEISIDTETNNSLDPITAKLMGAVLYTPREMWAYIPVNHINLYTGELLENQVTEQDIQEELQRIVDAKTFVIMHNASFDYNVLKMTCGIEIEAQWDTIIAAHLINENEPLGLKEQYVANIDTTWERYSIEGLFKGEKYEEFDPEVFALYAAPDGVMTYNLYKYQKNIMEQEDYSKVYKLFKEVEMPCVYAVADMELNGIELDVEHTQRLSNKYTKLLENVDIKINNEIDKYRDKISAWRLTPNANIKPKTAKGKQGKSKNEQLPEDINLSSPTQLSILLYDIIGVPVIDQRNPRGTGADILEQIDINLTKLMVERRKIAILLNTFIDALPKYLNPVSRRIHGSFRQTGTDTGRFSSRDPNMQNIPQGNTEIRVAFRAGDVYKEVEEENKNYKVENISEILTTRGWVPIKELVIGDVVEDDTIIKIDQGDIFTEIFVE